jgi:ribosomal protein S27E
VCPILSSLGPTGCLRWPAHVGCFAITTVFSHAQTVVLCGACSSVLCQPTGGKARLTEGLSLPCPRTVQISYVFPQAAHTVERTKLMMFWVSELSSCIVLHTHYLVLLIDNVNEPAPLIVRSMPNFKGAHNAGENDLKCAPLLSQLLRWGYPGSHSPLLREVNNEYPILGKCLLEYIMFRGRVSRRQSSSLYGGL